MFTLQLPAQLDHKHDSDTGDGRVDHGLHFMETCPSCSKAAVLTKHVMDDVGQNDRSPSVIPIQRTHYERQTEDKNVSAYRVI